jgi:hypothetical protein
MKQRPMGRADWLFVLILLVAGVLVFWALFGTLIWMEVSR